MRGCAHEHRVGFFTKLGIRLALGVQIGGLAFEVHEAGGESPGQLGGPLSGIGDDLREQRLRSVCRLARGEVL